MLYSLPKGYEAVDEPQEVEILTPAGGRVTQTFKLRQTKIEPVVPKEKAAEPKANPEATLRELFGRIAFNMACGNTDDHGRNHAAFVGTTDLELTPAYDICPQARSGESASQAMAFDAHGNRDARFSLLLDAAPLYLLQKREASDIVAGIVATIHDHWNDICDAAELTAHERSRFWGRQFLNPHLFEA